MSDHDPHSDLLPSLHSSAGITHNATSLIDQGPSLRIPELRNIPLSAGLNAIIDHPAFQRLRRIRQLGPTHLVYPGAVHTRFEHSLGVYGCAMWFLQSLLRHQHIRDSLSQQDLQTVLAAALLHDIGHYPFAHSLEALHLKGKDTPKHEDVGAQIILGQLNLHPDQPSIATLLKQHWHVEPERVIAICTGDKRAITTPTDKLLRSIISGAIDADKMDYIERDSHHMGVPYGRHYDRQRLLSSLTLNHDEDGLAIEAKGKVSAEMFIFSRYTMFSEAYWHHTVRAASAMVEQALATLHPTLEQLDSSLIHELLSRDDDRLLEWLWQLAPAAHPAKTLLHGLIGYRRSIYKRVMTLSRAYLEDDKRAAYNKIYNLDAIGIQQLKHSLCQHLSAQLNQTITPDLLIIDTPPRDKDRLETVQIVYPNAPGQRHYPLHKLSSIVSGIQDDFTAVVKKIRIFAHPQLAPSLQNPQTQESTLEHILSWSPT